MEDFWSSEVENLVRTIIAADSVAEGIECGAAHIMDNHSTPGMVPLSKIVNSGRGGYGLVMHICLLA